MGYHPALKYAYLDSGDVWQVETVAPDGYGETALALDANEYPHIAFGRYSNNQVGHAYWDGSTWQIEDVAYAGLWPSVALAFDDAGNLFIAYYDTVNKDLRYAFYLKTEYSVFVPHVLR
jgi:hypothetical protein